MFEEEMEKTVMNKIGRQKYLSLLVEMQESSKNERGSLWQAWLLTAEETLISLQVCSTHVRNAHKISNHREPMQVSALYHVSKTVTVDT